MTKATAAAKPPAGLGKEGAELWRSVLAEMAEDELEPTAQERRYLLDACREADVIASISSSFEGEPHVVKGSQGQPVAHPLLAELRQHRATLSQLLARVKMGAALADDRGHRWTSSDARAAANARWANRG